MGRILPVQRTHDAAAPAIEDMGVDHRRADILVAEQLLDGANVIARLQEMCGERVAECVRGGGLVDTGISDGLCNGPLDGLLVDVMAAGSGRSRIL